MTNEVFNPRDVSGRCSCECHTPAPTFHHTYACCGTCPRCKADRRLDVSVPHSTCATCRYFATFSDGALQAAAEQARASRTSFGTVGIGVLVDVELSVRTRERLVQQAADSVTLVADDREHETPRYNAGGSIALQRAREAGPNVEPLHLDPWKEDCLKYRGRELTGKVAHACPDWDGLPVDETCSEWPCPCLLGRAFELGRSGAGLPPDPPPTDLDRAVERACQEPSRLAALAWIADWEARCGCAFASAFEAVESAWEKKYR